MKKRTNTMKLKKINTILIVFSVAFIAFSILSAALYFRPSAVRFAVRLQERRKTSFFDQLLSSDYSTYLFDLKEDGTLYILRGMCRLDEDLSKPLYITFCNLLSVTKLKQEEKNMVLEAAEILSKEELKIDGTVFADRFTYMYQYFNNKTIRFENDVGGFLYSTKPEHIKSTNAAKFLWSFLPEKCPSGEIEPIFPY